MSPRKLLRRLYRKLPRPSLHFRCRWPEKRHFESLPPKPIVYDIGSKRARGEYPFASFPADARVICVDLFPGPGVDIVADAHDMHMIESNSADCVLCVALLLHCQKPARVVAEICRILKPGGIAYVSVPFIFPTCEDPHDYHRFSTAGLDVLCKELTKLDGGFYRGPASTMCPLLVEFLAVLLSFGQESLYTVWHYSLLWILFPMKYLDALVSSYPRARMLYSASFFLGMKSGPETLGSETL